MKLIVTLPMEINLPDIDLPNIESLSEDEIDRFIHAIGEKIKPFFPNNLLLIRNRFKAKSSFYECPNCDRTFYSCRGLNAHLSNSMCKETESNTKLYLWGHKVKSSTNRFLYVQIDKPILATKSFRSFSILKVKLHKTEDRIISMHTGNPHKVL